MLVWGGEIEVARDMSEGKSMTSEAIPPSRIKIDEYLLRTNGKGDIVSTLGPCVCGAGKREWHKICLKEERNGTKL